MNFSKTIFLFVLLGFFAVPFSSVKADIVVRTGETISINNEQKIEGDFYTLASILSISGEVTEDLVAASGEMTLNGSVAKDALLAGGNVDIHGAIGDDLRVVGGNVVIAKPIAGDVFVVGAKVTILSTASIGGDLLVYGGDVEVSGSVGGDIVGEVDTLRIDAPIAGNIGVTTDNLIIGDKADISGTVSYVSTNLLTRSQNSKIAGDISRNDPVVDTSTVTVKMVLVPVLVLLFSVLVWYLIARSFLTSIVKRALSRNPRPVLLGALTLFITPLVAVVLTVSVLGTLVGITAFFAYVLVILLAVISSSAVLGQLIFKLINKKTTSVLTPVSLGVGVLGVCVCVVIPIVGPLLLLALFIITLGALVDILLKPNVT
jgi:hypothetical protein